MPIPNDCILSLAACAVHGLESFWIYQVWSGTHFNSVQLCRTVLVRALQLSVLHGETVFLGMVRELHVHCEAAPSWSVENNANSMVFCLTSHISSGLEILKRQGCTLEGSPHSGARNLVFFV